MRITLYRDLIPNHSETHVGWLTGQKHARLYFKTPPKDWDEMRKSGIPIPCWVAWLYYTVRYWRRR